MCLQRQFANTSNNRDGEEKEQKRMQRGRDMQHENDEIKRSSRLSGTASVIMAFCVLFAGYLLFQLGEGFPSRAWHLLSVALAGEQTGLPFSCILIQSLVMLIAWLFPVLVALQVIRSGCHEQAESPTEVSPMCMSSSPLSHAPSAYLATSFLQIALEAGGSDHLSSINKQVGRIHPV